MSDEPGKQPPHVSTSALEALLDDPPWKTKSFMAAGAATVAGFGAWMNDMMSPALARGGASYIGGFLIGWAFRRVLKVAVLGTGMVLALLASLKSLGWIELNWPIIEQNVSESFAWLTGQAESLKQLLTGYLPSAGAGGAGAYFGFRKKS